MATSSNNPLRYNDFFARLEQAYQAALQVLGEPGRHHEIPQISDRMRALLAEAVDQQYRDALRSVIAKLVLAGDEAFRQGGGPRTDRTLTDWGHLWVAFADLGEDLLRLEPDGDWTDDLAYVRDDPMRERYLRTFLNDNGDPVPMRLREVAKEVAKGLQGDSGGAIPESNAVYNRLVRLAQHRLVKRAGPLSGLYELTRRGYVIARSLHFCNNPDALPTDEQGNAVRYLMAFVDKHNNAQPAGPREIIHRLRAENQPEPDSDTIHGFVSAFLAHKLIRPSVPGEDEYQLTSLGERLTQDLHRLVSKEPKPVFAVDPFPSASEGNAARYLLALLGENGERRALSLNGIRKMFPPAEQRTSGNVIPNAFVTALLDCGLMRRAGADNCDFELTPPGYRLVVDIRRILAAIAPQEADVPSPKKGNGTSNSNYPWATLNRIMPDQSKPDPALEELLKKIDDNLSRERQDAASLLATE